MVRKRFLKSRVMFFAILALFSGTSHAKYKKAEALMDVPGKKPVMVEVNTTGSEQLVFNYKIPEADLVTLKEKFDGESVKRLYLGNAPLTNDEGKPVLPVIPAQFIIPAGKTIASVQIERNEKTILWGKNFVEFGKAKIPLIKDAKFKKSFPNPDIYQKDDAYPSKNGSLITIQKKRGVNIGIVNVNPVQYHPKSGKLVVYSNLVVHIILKNDTKNFKSTIPAKVNTLNPSSLGVENPEAIETYKPQTPSLLNYKTNGICASAAQYSYVLITSQSICDAKTDYTVHDLINQRLSQGVTATIVTIEEILKNYTGVDDAEKLRNFIIDAYTNWNTQYVALGGDVSIIPYRNLYSDGEYIPSDLYFQCLDGSYNSDGDLYWGESTDGEGGGDVDLMSEVSVGRISAETPEEMANFIYKTITYENLPSETSYLSRACIAGEYLGEQFGPGEFSFATPYMEEIRKGSSTSGYTTKGFTDCSAFSEDTVYDAPSFEWSKDSILNIINTGKYSIINHLGHANETYVMKFENSDADRLTNTNPLFAYSQGCYPGHFPLDCMAEHLTTSTRSGMFAVVFNSVYGYGGYNESKETLDGPSQRFDRQFWDGFFNETIFRIGDLNADSHEDNLWCINTDLIRYCMYETTLFGDPYTMLRGMIQGPSLVYSSQTISDLRGNNDQIANPGESIDLSVTVKNIGSEASQIANCVLTGTDPYVTIRSSTSSLPAINCCGTSQPLSTPLQLDIKSDCPTPYTAPFTLSISSGDSTWNLNVSVNVFRSSAISGLILANTGDTPIQGATVYYKGPVSGMISSGADGSYSCKLIEGTYSVWVNAAGYLSSDTMFFSIPPAAEYNFRMYRPHLSVTPATIAEELKTDDSLSVNVTLDNTGDAPLNVVINNRLISKPLKTGNPKLIESLIPHSEKRFFSFKNNKNTMIPNMYKPERYDGNGAKVLYLNSLNLDSMKDYFSEGLRQLPVVASLDIVDGTRYTPNLEYLMQYDCVILSSGDYWADAELLGNTLADYADNGKLIVLLAGTFATGGDWQLKGRIAEPEYMPLTMGSGLEAKCVANNFADHKLTSNIKNISTMIIVNSPSVQGNGVALGYYNCDSILAAAYNASYPIVAINVIPVDGYWGGDVITMVSNSIEWAASEQRWLQVEPENKLISILPGASKDISVNLNSLTLIGGLYTGEILFTHNDPSSTNPVVLPVSMTVDGFRSLSVNPESITFDPIWYGNTDTASITLINNGSEATSIQSITSNSEVFSCIQSTPLTVKPRKTAKLSFVFNPTSTGNFPGTIKISSNAEDNSTIDVPVSATATEGPSASVSPDALSFSFQPKDVPADRTVVLSNTGAAPLVYSVRIQQTGKPVFVFDHNKQPLVKKGLIYNKQNYTHPFVENTVLVGMKQGKTTFAQSNLLNQIGIESVTELAKGINPKTKVKGFTTRTLLKMKLYSTGKDAVLSAIRQISKDPNVEYAEPDYIVKAINTPNDEYFSRLYAMNNQGQTGGKVDADIDAVEAWDSFTGNPDDILIGVIDTGIDYLHPDLVDNIWKNPGEIPNNGIDDDGNGFIDDYYGWDFAYDDNDPDDQHGHGTHVSGTIAGKGNNGIGVTGVMWNARVMALKFLDASGSGTTSDAIDAVNYATIMNVQVTNNSWGGGGYSQALEEAIASSGIFVAAAGNNGTDNDQYPEYPGSYTLDNIISVAATDHNDSLAYFSCYGRNSVDLSAPGVDILSSLPGNNYDAWSGTSMATPHVTGAVALLWSNNSSLTSTDVKSAILQSVDKIPSLENRTVSGGRLNIQKMLELAGNSWLTIAPKTADTLQSSGTKEFTITANPEKMEAGHWTAEVTFKTDDPFHKDVTVNVSADVAGCKSVETSGETVSFGKVWVNRDTVVNITLANTCNDMVTISGCSFENPAFKTNVELFPIYIKPFGKIELPVTFAPESSGPFNSQAIISSDAEDNPSLSVNLAGVGLTPPTITLNPSSIMKNLHFGSVDTTVVALTNSGEADYHFKTRTKMQKNSNSLGVEDATLFGATWNTIFKIDPNTGNITDSIMISDSSGSLQEIAFDGQYIYYSHSNAITVLDPETKMIVKTITFTDKYYYFGPIGVSDEYIYVFDWVSQDLLTISKKDNSIINTYSLFSMIDLTYSETRNSIFFTDYNNAIYEINPSTGEVLNKIDNVEHLMSLGFSSAADLLFGVNWDGKLMALNPENGSKVKEYPYNPNYFRLAADEVTAGPRWLDVNPEEGIVSAASSFSLNTMFDTRKLFPGTYNAAVVLSHRFGLLPDITIPCTLSVDSENRLRVNPTALSFNEVWKGRSDSSVIYLVNDGNEATTVSSVIPTNTVFSTSFVSPVTIDAFDSVPVMVRCYPTKLGITQGTIKITSNADDHPLIKMDVKVTTVKPPKISINPGSISVTMLPGQQVDHFITVKNTGGADYAFKAKIVTNSSLASNSGEIIALRQDLVKIDPATGLVTDTILDSANAYSIAYDGNLIYLNYFYDNYSIQVVDPEAKQVVKTIQTPIRIRGLAVSENYLFATSDSLGMYVLNKTTGEIISFWNTTSYFTDFTYCGDRGSIYAFNFMKNSIEEYNSENGNLISSIPTRSYYNSLAYSSSMKMLLGSNKDMIDFYDPETGSLQRTLKIDYAYSIASDEVAVSRWIATTVTKGVITKDGGVVDINLHFNSTKMVPGVYNAMLIIEHDKGWTPGPFVVNCKLKVNAQRLISVSTDNLSFGTITVGDTGSFRLELTNDGNDTTTIRKVSSSSKEFALSVPGPFVVPPFSKTVVDALYIPINKGKDSALLTLKTNASNVTTVILNVKGEGITGRQNTETLTEATVSILKK